MGGGCDDPACGDAAAATEMPAAAPEESFAQEAMSTMTANPAEDSTRIMETQSAKEGATETENQPEVQPEPSVPFNWTFFFLIITIAGGVILWSMRLFAKRKWR
ncbi:MAG: hypothetical protein HYU84_10785 [Chloroflexi bacterium]|nr:hypothetical protein [Chloroflexota bacterium]